MPFGVPTADYNADGVVDAGDYDDFVNDWTVGTHKPRLDQDLDGSIGSFDYDDWVSDFFDGYASGSGKLSRSDVANRSGYGGYDWDPVTSRYHVRNRVLAPELGRWINRDPLDYLPGMNLYSYVENDPLRSLDPYGLIDDPGFGKHDYKDPSFYPEGHPARNRAPRPPKPRPSPSTTDRIVDWIGPDRVLNCTGGPGYVPGIDQGPTQDVIVLCCDGVSLAAPCGAGVRVITCGGKGLRAIKEASVINKYTRIERIRRYIRYDRPHHGKPRQWDGTIPNKIREWLP